MTKHTFTTSAPKQPHELQDDFDGEYLNRRVILIFHNGEEYHGVFRGMDNEDLICSGQRETSPQLSACLSLG